ncbi:type II toxin-antitoxin system prevent-host-death family antitoxin [Deltaproteobacteria bacterium PRO3]|nr:type II toxin-antitoxin system prevent-host-death family antitoxin [Deltaproteobacteria bacterium]MDL1872801.1 type II toxin-antitoxin system prevent-host-death family antitoxin [Deltaproteobacteria bacterium PRO3]
MEIGVYEAKTHLPKLLERVSKGEVITITRHGTPVATLSPVQKENKLSIKEAIEGLIELKKRVNVKVSPKELRKMRETGRR